MVKNNSLTPICTTCIIGVLLGGMMIPIVNTETGNVDISTSNSSIRFSTDGNTLYVGGNGPNNYTRIQDAIDDAKTEDTIYVYSGIYMENLMVDKSIDLVGENKKMTIIDGNGSGTIAHFSAPGIKIRKFTLTNGGTNQDDGGITINSNHNTIQDTIINNNNESQGIQIIQAHHNTIYGNTIKNNYIGISIYQSHHNTIQKNNVTTYNNTCPESTGLLLLASRHNLVTGNTFQKNDIGLYIGNTLPSLLMTLPYFNTITTNNFLDNSEHASFLNSFFNTWSHNYWDDYNGTGPKYIPGFIGDYLLYPLIFNWTNIEWNPAKEPYTWDD